MSDDVWSERDTNPDAIDAALRDLLRRRHAANRALAPARVLNLIVVIDRAQSGALKEQLDCFNNAATQDDTLGVIEVHHRCQAIAEIVGGFCDNLNDEGIAVLDGVG